MFDKNPWEWEKADIEQLINTQTEENINLDYKASDSLDKTDGKKKEISKDVSAFANSDGGVIIYGVRENSAQRNLPEKIDVGLDPSIISKEWIEQVVNSGIKPKIQGLRIKSVTVDSEKVIYVIYIPKSMTAHQASDNRYYKRYNFQSIPMEHFELLDVLNRAVLPDLEPEFCFVSAGNFCHLVVFLDNRGTTVIKNVSLELSLPSIFISDLSGVNFKREDYRNLVTNFGLKGYEFSDLTFRNDNKEVIFPKQKLGFIVPDGGKRITIVKSPPNPLIFSDGKLFWELFADNMPFKSGEISFDSIKYLK
ncbi:MAG: ATP-binding protein [Candidatus Omnitrophota bacterium]|jgi:hypothetical protein